MTDINLLTTVWQTISPYAQDVIPIICTAIMTSLFTKKNTAKQEFEKLRQKKLSEVADYLLEEGHLTYYERFKANNFLSIAKKADIIVREQGRPLDIERSIKETPRQGKFDMDWFIRFFEAVGGISDEDMQLLWARVMAGEVGSQGSFSLRTLDTLCHLSPREAELFQEIANCAFKTSDAEWFIIGEGESTFEPDELYDMSDIVIPNKKVRVLQECGLLNPIKGDYYVFYSTEPLKSPIETTMHHAIMNENTILLFHSKASATVKGKNSKPLFFPYYPFTEAGRQLLSIVRTHSEYDFLLELGQTIIKHNTRRKVKNYVSAHYINKVTETHIYFDQSIDRLRLE